VNVGVKRNLRCVLYRRGAGILPYCQGLQGKRYFLLGLERRNAEGAVFSAFGGYENPEDGRDLKETAIREALEESHGCFGDAASLRHALNNNLQEIGKNNFLVNLGTINQQQRRNMMEEFTRSNNKAGLRHSQREMSVVVWVPAAELYRALHASRINRTRCSVDGYFKRDQFLRRYLQNFFGIPIGF